MAKYSEVHLLSNKFDFEVPLEDLCPANYLHPKILIMYIQAFRSFSIHNITLDMLLSTKFEGREDKIQIKKTLLNFKQPKLNGTPQSFIWLIEHFLGLLPIPLLASYINGNYFNWYYLAQECRKFLDKNYKRKTKNCDYFDRQICNGMAKLPPQHKLLLNQHIEFIRNISILDTKKIKRSVVYYCKYFTASLLLRPFRSGLKNDSETDYYFLILYMTLRWPSINKIPKEYTVTAVREVSELDSLLVLKPTVDEIKYKKYTKRRYRISLKSHIIENENYETDFSVRCISHDGHMSGVTQAFSMMSIPKVSVKSSNEQLAEGSSTETADRKVNIHDISKLRLESINVESYEEDTYKNGSSEEYSLQIKCTQNTEKGNKKCSTDADHEIVSKPEQISQRKHQTLAETNNNIEEERKNIESSTQNATIYEECQSIPVISSESTNPENITIDTNILKKISKVGWTYTPHKIKERQPYENTLTKNIFDDQSTQQELIKGTQSETMLRRYPSVKSFRSRLSIFKIGKNRTGNKKFNTNFKYTKINS